MKYFQSAIFSLLLLVSITTLWTCKGDIEKQIAYEKEPFKNFVTIDYLLSEHDIGKGFYVDVVHQIEIDPERSALVIIDLWQESFLDSITVNNINPLIKEFDDLGMKIIYSPSQLPQNKNLFILENGVHFFNHDMMDKFLLENQIENLFYVGFDNFYCVLDKPNGIYSFLSRNDGMNIFVVEGGTLSFTKEMKKVSSELLKKNGVGYIISKTKRSEHKFPKKTLTGLTAKTKNTIKPGNNFIVLYKGKTKNNALERFEYALKENGIDHAVVKNERMFFKQNEISPYDFIRLLRNKNIKNIYYGGFHLNNELLWSDYGLIAMYIKMRYAQIKGMPQLNVINDLAFIVPTETIDPTTEKATIINHYREIGNVMSNTLLEGIEKNRISSSQEVNISQN